MKVKSLTDDKTTYAITRLLESFVHAWNAKDLDAFAACFAENAEFSDATGQIARGRDAIRHQHHYSFTVDMREAVLTPEDLYLRALRSDLLLGTANWRIEDCLTPGGEALPVRHGLMQVVFEQKEKEWKILLVHNLDHALPYEREERFIGE